MHSELFLERTFRPPTDVRTGTDYGALPAPAGLFSEPLLLPELLSLPEPLSAPVLLSAPETLPTGAFFFPSEASPAAGSPFEAALSSPFFFRASVA